MMFSLCLALASLAVAVIAPETNQHGQSGFVFGGVHRAQRRTTGIPHGLHLGHRQLGATFLAAIPGLLDAVLLEVHGRK